MARRNPVHVASKSGEQELNVPENNVRLKSLSIENFKGLDRIKLEFAETLLADEIDVFVMGSRNGLGKTAILEACSLLYCYAISTQSENELNSRLARNSVNLPNLLLRAGSTKAVISGKFSSSEETVQVMLSLHKDGRVKFEGDKNFFQKLIKNKIMGSNIVEKVLASIAGLNNEPLILPSFMYFNSYRKIQEGNPELSMMLEPDPTYRLIRYRSSDIPMSTLKVEMLRLMMSRASLFDNLNEQEADVALERLNQLMETYTGGRIEKLRPSPDNTIEFRVTTKAGNSFTFDGLSSGQKEIISTLFLIWKYTHENPGIVLIDEPELHLNPEWQVGFVRSLYNLVPNNQYIIATHSEEIFGSVDSNRRFLLSADK